MEFHSVSVSNSLVLIGGGHSHVAVLKRFAMSPLPGTRLVVIARDLNTPYSGMLPGFVAGHYRPEECHIDLGPLCRAAGARLIHGAAVGLNPAERRVLIEGRSPVDYDLLSVDIGATPSRIAGVEGANVLPVKPIDRFLARWGEIEPGLRSASRVIVIGAGAGGVEICLALQHRLRAKGLSPRMAIVDGAPSLLPTYPAQVRTKFAEVLGARGVELHLGHPVARIDGRTLRRPGASDVDFDIAVLATPAAPHVWIRDSGIATDAAGFVAVSDRLQSVSHPQIFAAGDVAAIHGHGLAKSGVFAVREGPILADNLRRAVRGEPLRPYRPQKRFLSLISTGDKYAVASRGRYFFVAGSWVWRWKDRIDRRWMEGYQRIRPMAPVKGTDMRCGGCAAKIGGRILESALEAVAGQQANGEGVLIGLDQPDDAAVLAPPPGKALVQSVDFFRAFIDDPYAFGRIAANHCLGDLYAMGAEPHSALAIATLPHAAPQVVSADLKALMAGAGETLKAAGCRLVGGHSGEGEMGFGLSVNGWADPQRLVRKGGAGAGDVLILTKPLGTGVLFAADMRGEARSEWVAAALSEMRRSNQAAARILAPHATSGTDVTGFGLAGHLLEMLRASSLGAELRLDRIPTLAGARDLLNRGFASTLQSENVALAEAAIDGAAPPILFDPQTAGGLLMSVPESAADGCLRDLRAEGYEAAAVGNMRPRNGAKLIAVR